jgi:NADPH-dependent glutamate synthase beta subunit-like oxidoreductase
VANPVTGNEHDVRSHVHASATRRVLVVGGGPAGLDVARRLAEAGHIVLLWEAADALGGRLALAARGDDALDRFLAWLLAGVARADVDVRLGTTATLDAVHAAGVDEVVLATGGRWDASVELVQTAGRTVAIVGADVPGLGLAEMWARAGGRVTVHDDGSVAGLALGLPGRFRRVHDLQALGVRFELGQPVDLATIGADTVIDARARPGDGALARALRDSGARVHVIGDAHAVGYLEGALASVDALVRDLAGESPARPEHA